MSLKRKRGEAEVSDERKRTKSSVVVKTGDGHLYDIPYDKVSEAELDMITFREYCLSQNVHTDWRMFQCGLNDEDIAARFADYRIVSDFNMADKEAFVFIRIQFYLDYSAGPGGEGISTFHAIFKVPSHRLLEKDMKMLRFYQDCTRAGLNYMGQNFSEVTPKDGYLTLGDFMRVPCDEELNNTEDDLLHTGMYFDYMVWTDGKDEILERLKNKNHWVGRLSDEPPKQMMDFSFADYRIMAFIHSHNQDDRSGFMK